VSIYTYTLTQTHGIYTVSSRLLLLLLRVIFEIKMFLVGWLAAPSASVFIPLYHHIYTECKDYGSSSSSFPRKQTKKEKKKALGKYLGCLFV
jgi:hypothetical protein